MSGQVRSEDTTNEGSRRTRRRRFRLGATGLAVFTAGALFMAACTTVKPSATSTTSTGTSPAGVTLSTPSPNSGSYNPETDPVVQAIQKVEPAVVNVTTNVVEQNP